MAANRKYCVLLRTKMAYFRSPDGERLTDPDDPTACYACLLTQRPFGPDGAPANAETCGEERVCFREET